MALQYLANHLDVDINETMAIGDNYNDHSMFKVAGFAVGVANMVAELRDEVDFITEASNDEDAIAEIMGKFILNDENQLIG